MKKLPISTKREELMKGVQQALDEEREKKYARIREQEYYLEGVIEFYKEQRDELRKRLSNRSAIDTVIGVLIGIAISMVIIILK